MSTSPGRGDLAQRWSHQAPYLAAVLRMVAAFLFIAHGTNDQQMPIVLTGRKYAAVLKDEGYEVVYREYEGGHGTPPAIVREAFAWLAGPPPQ